MASLIEMCCGYGGATRGLLDAGLVIEAAYDIWPVAVQQHHAWLPGVPCEVRDVATITPDELAGRFVWASLPCQPWSIANQVRRGTSHPHYYDLAHFAHQVQHARVAVIENVPGLLQTRDGQAEMQRLNAAAGALGMTVQPIIIPAAAYGVTQRRDRAFVIVGRDAPLLMAATGVPRGVPLEYAPLATEYKSRPGTTGIAQGRTIEAAAAAQGLPVPQGVTRKAAYTLIGNAVPPKLARAIAEQVFLPLLNEVGAA